MSVPKEVVITRVVGWKYEIADTVWKQLVLGDLTQTTECNVI